jgi:molybdenum cofactor cytidylyltransferase
MIPAVILAAGLSTRMGRTKALLPFDQHESFLAHLVRTFRAAAVEDVIVVTGHDGAAVAAEVDRAALPARVLHNPDFARGQFSSLLTALADIDEPGVEAMLMTLVDVPGVTAETVRAVLDRFEATRAPIVRPVRGSEHGHPVLVARTLFASLRGADPAFGAKPIVRANVSQAGDVPVDDDGAFADVDTPEAYRRAFGRTLS